MESKIINNYESNVRIYSRHFPIVFKKASGCIFEDVDGKEYMDFFSGGGSLNYGHNEPNIKKKIIDYIANDGVVQGMDLITEVKEVFLQAFEEKILQKRGLDYKVQFTGPTGTNTIESAIRLARKIKNRSKIMCFTNSFHGMTFGAFSITSCKKKINNGDLYKENIMIMPFDGYMNGGLDSLEYIDTSLQIAEQNLSLPAAAILETMQVEGGLNIASNEWLRGLQKILEKYGILMIIDDIQVGCGRSGSFFSFERAEIKPDIVCLSKSIGGFGTPMALTLMKPEFDVWSPAEFSGTFRGNNLAFIGGAEAINTYWSDKAFIDSVNEKAKIIEKGLNDVNDQLKVAYPVRGRGFLWGIDLKDEETLEKVQIEAFKMGLIIEDAGGRVLKVMPPLNISEKNLIAGMEIVKKSLLMILKDKA